MTCSHAALWGYFMVIYPPIQSLMLSAKQGRIGSHFYKSLVLPGQGSNPRPPRLWADTLTTRLLSWLCIGLIPSVDDAALIRRLHGVWKNGDDPKLRLGCKTELYGQARSTVYPLENVYIYIFFHCGESCNLQISIQFYVVTS